MQTHHVDEANTPRSAHGRAGEEGRARFVGGNQTPGLGVGDGDEVFSMALSDGSAHELDSKATDGGLTLSSSASRYCRARR